MHLVEVPRVARLGSAAPDGVVERPTFQNLRKCGGEPTSDACMILEDFTGFTFCNLKRAG